MMKLYKSRFRKEFIKGLIEAFDGTEDVICITIPGTQDGIEPYQKFYTASSPELQKLEHNPMFPSDVEIRPFEELWFETHRDKIEHLFIKNPTENSDGN
ncbi:hypothetical protein [uncultured Mediterranean phage uvMED]|mgnify:CR=1 FL=1|jgi:hypothetical protein|nr:hypothetical protein [uncultured phage MedDCM-OCT-S08-C582]BAQ86646.1 hypothetical protein [uncultured Mediterranean phage uvMED]BAQ86920.1 hypothetical protein [uncultured Mediterranean phage uvMED]BAR16477.1 hypothetical protein [uncultured Mediterranean phage uvMED]|tara:strand:- start:94 stop:390 length:297 start_codon:yes stop_codon:yes gene_type:complete